MVPRDISPGAFSSLFCPVANCCKDLAAASTVGLSSWGKKGASSRFTCDGLGLSSLGLKCVWAWTALLGAEDVSNCLKWMEKMRVDGNLSPQPDTRIQGHALLAVKATCHVCTRIVLTSGAEEIEQQCHRLEYSLRRTRLLPGYQNHHRRWRAFSGLVLLMVKGHRGLSKCK